MAMETFNGSNVTVGADTCTLFTSKAKCYAVWAPPRIAGVASMISCVIIVIILVALKKYKFLPQRLILYLTVAVFFNTVHALWGDFHLSNRANDGELIGFCIFQGFYHILTAWISFLWVCIITFSIVWTTVALKRTGKKFE